MTIILKFSKEYKNTYSTFLSNKGKGRVEYDSES